MLLDFYKYTYIILMCLIFSKIIAIKQRFYLIYPYKESFVNKNVILKCNVCT